jgi:hypothetical protein
MNVTFDLTTITARGIQPYLAKMATGHMGAFIQICPLVVTETDLGAPDKLETYDLPFFGEEVGFLWKTFTQAVKDCPEKITFASFDLGKIKGSEFDSLLDEIGNTDLAKVAAQLVKYVVTCPEVPDLHNPDAYLDLPYYTQFNPLRRKLSEAGEDQLENFLKRFGGS